MAPRAVMVVPAVRVAPGVWRVLVAARRGMRVRRVLMVMAALVARRVRAARVVPV